MAACTLLDLGASRKGQRRNKGGGEREGERERGRGREGLVYWCDAIKYSYL